MGAAGHFLGPRRMLLSDPHVVVLASCDLGVMSCYPPRGAASLSLRSVEALA